MADFTDGEKAFLRELQARPEWAAILDKLESEPRARAFRPDKGNIDEQIERWKYHSGVDAGREAVVERLRNAR